MADPRFTLVLQVKQVTPKTKVYRDNYDKVGTDVPRQVTDLANIELRSDDLEALLSDTKQHIDLIRIPTTK